MFFKTLLQYNTQMFDVQNTKSIKKNSKYSRKPSVFLKSLPNKLIKFLSKTKKNSGISGGPGPDRQEQESREGKTCRYCRCICAIYLWLCFFLVVLFLVVLFLAVYKLTKNTSLLAQCYYHSSNSTVL